MRWPVGVSSNGCTARRWSRAACAGSRGTPQRSCSLDTRLRRVRRCFCPRRPDAADAPSGQLTKHAARIARRNDVRRNVAHDDAARAYHRARADRNASANNGARADPGVLADRDRHRELESDTTFGGIDRMRRRDELYAARDEDAIADAHGCAVEHDAAHVGVDIVAEMNVDAVVAVE